MSIIPLLLALTPTTVQAGGDAQSLGDDLAALAERVRSETLDNGLRVVVLPRDGAPTASFRVYVQAGAMDEARGLTGLAHFAEHMAFKGSRRIGSRDWERERVALERCDAAWRAYEEAASGRTQADAARVEALRVAFEEARGTAAALSDAAAFDRAVEGAGGLDQNATTGADATQYFVSLPAERLEQWFWLTREQIGAPVFREFYRERDVVMEERRGLIGSNAAGALREALLQTAFVAHPYRDPAIGLMDDLRWLDRAEMETFWKTHYGAGRIVIAVVGRVDPDQVFAFARTYLGDLPRGAARPRRTGEPEQEGPRSVTVARPATPRALLAWQVPPLVGEAGLVHDALADLLAGTRAARLTRALMEEQGVASRVSASADYPGRLDPTLFVVEVRPVPGQPLRELVDLAQQELDRFAAEGPDDRELSGMKRRLKARLLRSLASDAGLAAALARAEADAGGWQEVFARVAAIDALDGEAIRAAAARLRAERRTTAWLRPAGEGGS
jgi:predicted Zn-dependent peptidase